MGEHIFHLQHQRGRRESDKNKCPILSFVFIFLAGIFSLKPIQNRILEVTHRSFAHPPPPYQKKSDAWYPKRDYISHCSSEKLIICKCHSEQFDADKPAIPIEKGGLVLWRDKRSLCRWWNKVNKNSQKETLRKSLVEQYLSKLPSSAPNLPRLKPRPLRKV